MIAIIAGVLCATHNLATTDLTQTALDAEFQSTTSIDAVGPSRRNGQNLIVNALGGDG